MVQTTQWVLSVIQSREFISALVGSLIGGIFVLIGTWITAYCDRQKKKDESQQLLKSTLSAISTELEILYERYQNTAGLQLNELSSGSSLDFYYSFTENYLTVFENNARLLGHLKDDELRKSIIRTYIDIKALIDGLKLNSTMLSNYDSLRSYDLFHANSFTQTKLQEIDVHRKKFGGLLKKEHDNLSIQIPRLIQKILTAINEKDL